MAEQDDFRKRLGAWNERLAKLEAKAKPRKRPSAFSDATDAAPLYTHLDTDGLDPARDLGLPGEPPFTRGVQPNMFRGRLWTMRQYAGFGTAHETNERFRYLLEQGQTGLSVAFDLPTQTGYDSDDPHAEGEVGRVGVAIDTLEDLELLFDKIPLDKVTTSMTINSTAAVLLAMYVAAAKRRGIAPAVLGGTIQNDVLKEYVARGTYIHPPRPSMRLITDIFAWCGRSVPKWNVISISGYHMREAGCNAVQEVAFTLADGLAYVQAAIDAGLQVDAFGERLSFFFASHNNLLEEVAKFRAARRLWARLMADRFGVVNPRALALRFHTQTGGCTLTAQQPLNNAVRVAFQALAAVLGGTQSLHTNSFDEALSLPTQDAVTLALRTQQIVAFETGAADTVDPLAGSYLVETLTNRIEHGAREYLRRIDELGGMVAAIEAGYVQREIQNTSYAFQLEVESGLRTVVGVNDFVSDAPKPKTLRIDPRIEREQVERLRAVRAKRDAKAWATTLERLEAAARDPKGELMPQVLAAVEALASIGEISGVLRKVFGEYREVVTV
ncbi:MAG: methylmalonyl-CoA mutase [Deltaproteobacteria bacterium]|nr:methylmalonyl-CoA mutase [Deltaproteobacteria bacterium]